MRIASICPGPFLPESAEYPNASHTSGRPKLPRVTQRGSFNGSMPLKDPLDVSRRSLDREVVAVVLQALLQSLLQLLNAATLHEHVPVGTCGLLILGVGGGITVD